jgi:hypothetical protein
MLIVWLLLLAGVLAMWVRSFWRLDVFSTVRQDGSTRALLSYQGAWHWVSVGTNGRARPVQFDSYHIPADATYAAVHRAGSVQWATLGFVHVKTTPTIRVPVPGQNRLVTVAVPPGGAVLPFGVSTVGVLTPWLGAAPYEAVIVPYWSIALLPAVYPLLRGRNVVRGILRRRRGRCVTCGYDLRASPDRCPECGAVPRPSR